MPVAALVLAQLACTYYALRIPFWNAHQQVEEVHALSARKRRMESIPCVPHQSASLVSLLLAFTPAAGWSNTAGAGCFNSPRVSASQAGISMDAVLDAYGDDRQSMSASTRGKRTSHSDVLDLAKVVEIVGKDIPNILRKEPTWDIFAPDFQLIDHTGARLEGLSASKQLMKLLRRIREQFVVRDYISVNTMVRTLDAKPSFAVRWKVQLGGEELEGNTVDIEAETLFHLNDKNQLDYMRIHKCKTSGYEFRFWPEVKLSSDLLENLQAIKQWAREIHELNKIREPMTPLQILSISPEVLDDDTEACENSQALPITTFDKFKDWFGNNGLQLLFYTVAILVLQGALDASHQAAIPSSPTGGFWFVDGMVYFNGEWF